MAEPLHPNTNLVIKSPCTGGVVSTESGSATDALRTHYSKWYDKDFNEEDAPIGIIKSEEITFYTREELALLGINLLEKE